MMCNKRLLRLKNYFEIVQKVNEKKKNKRIILTYYQMIKMIDL